MSEKRYGSSAERQKAYRKRSNLSGGVESGHAGSLSADNMSPRSTSGEKSDSGSSAPPAQNSLTAVPVLAEPDNPMLGTPEKGGGEARCSTKGSDSSIAAAVEANYEYLPDSRSRKEIEAEKGASNSTTVSGSGVPTLREREKTFSEERPIGHKVSSPLEGENRSQEREDSKTGQVPGMPETRKIGRPSQRLRQATGSDMAVPDVPRTTVKPSHIPQKEWEYALERAQRATDYAAMFPLHVRPLELKYQDPLWQWEHHVKERSSPNQTR